jgi:urea carboxylase/allophanate hydrolase
MQHSVAEADGIFSDLIKISDADLDLNEREQWLVENEEDFTAGPNEQSKAMHNAEFFEDLIKPYDLVTMRPGLGRKSDKGMIRERVKAPLPGRCFRCATEEDEFQADHLVSIDYIEISCQALKYQYQHGDLN